jgi:ribosome-associated protein
LTTKKHGGSGGARPHANQPGDPSRPRIKTSHERLEPAGGIRSRKARRDAPRAAGQSRTPVAKERGQGLRKTRPAREAAAAPPERAAWGSVASEAARETARAIAIAALDKKAVGLEILDVAGRVDYADFLVIMTGRSDRHTHALAQGIEEALKRSGLRPLAVEGLPHGSWVLMDFGDVVVHVFQDEARQLYDLEGLWLDARRLPVPSPAPNQGT